MAKVQMFEPLAAMVEQYFKAVGIDVKLDLSEFNTFVAKKLIPHDYDMIGAWWITPPDPDAFPYFHSSGAVSGNNTPMYKDPVADTAGVVQEVGEGVSNVKPGDPVMLYPGLFCGECEWCEAGEQSMCDHYRIFGEHT